VTADPSVSASGSPPGSTGGAPRADDELRPSEELRGRSLTVTRMRAVQITRFGGPQVMDVVDPPDPTPGDGEQLFDISSSRVTHADTHHRRS
jgi:hypothetical protein